MRRVLLIIGVIIVLAVVGFALTRKSPAASNAAPSSLPSSQSAAQTAATITYDASGFHPALTVVTSGAVVTFVNRTTGNIQVDSDPHPIHTDDTDLNVGTIEPGQSRTATVKKKGTFGFHNHLMPSDQGKITVE